MNLQQIVRFYLACIETEDLRAVSKRLSALNSSLLSPWDTTETLFSQSAESVTVQASTEPQRRFLRPGAALAGEPEHLFYGYPIYLYEDEREFVVSPLFMQEVEASEKEVGIFEIRPSDPDAIEVNQHLFRRQHVQPEEMRMVVRELEGGFSSFEERLTAAFQLLGVPQPRFDPSHLDPWPGRGSADPRWINRPVLFKSERSLFTMHLKRELALLAKDPNLGSSASGTALGQFFGARSKLADGQSRVPLVPVVPLNESQKTSAMRALKEPLTVVTGPPGTGKSQVVLDLLASCALAGKPVLFASKNNKAVDVVRQRLRDLLGDTDDWVLRLGNHQVTEECRQAMDLRLAAVRTRSVEVCPSPEVVNSLESEIQANHQRIENLRTLQPAMAALEVEARALEAVLPVTWVEACKGREVPPFSAQQAQEMQEFSKRLGAKRAGSPYLWFLRTFARKRVLEHLLAGLAQVLRELPDGVCRDLDVPPLGEATFSALAEAFARIAAFGRWRQAVLRAEEQAAAILASESASDLARKLEELQVRRSELAALEFRARWSARIGKSNTHYRLNRFFDLMARASRLHDRRDAAQFSGEWSRQVSSLGNDLPIWIVTNLSARRSLPLCPALFDLVIIDEASQCDIPSAIPLLYRARRALIIGDAQQLSHISTLQAIDEDKLAKQFGLASAVSRWSYGGRSLYNLAEEVAVEQGNPVGFLTEHYRSHPEIVEFSNRSFYNGRLILRTRVDKLAEKTSGQPLGVFWHDVRGQMAWSPRSAVNDVEVREVITLLNEWAESGLLLKKGLSFGVVTPFRFQMEKLIAAVQRCPWYSAVEGRLTIGTAHRFQGDECDIMIFSPVVSKGMSERLVRWAADTDQLLNVAITRARAALHVVGDLESCLGAGGRLGDFASSVQAGLDSRGGDEQTETPAERAVQQMLVEIGLWHKSQYVTGRYRLDFLVVSPLGTRYDLEVDGRGHLLEESIREDQVRDSAMRRAGLNVIRIDARKVFRDPERTKALLARIC